MAITQVNLCYLAFPIKNCRIFTVQRSYASVVLGVVILSVRSSVTRVLCD